MSSANQSSIENVRRGLRAIYWGGASARSRLRLWWFGLLFGGLSVGKKVTLGPNATLRVLRGGRLDICDEVTIEANCQIVVEGAVTIGPRSFIGVGSII